MFENNNDLKVAITNSIIGTPLTANGIAKSLGYNKATDRIKNMIIAMVKVGELVENNSDRYTTYRKPTSTILQVENPTNNDDDDCSDDMPDDDSVDEAEVSVATFEIPSNSFGFTVTKSNNPRFAYTVATPEGKEIDLVSCERIISINQNADYRYIVSTPEDVMKAVGEFTHAMGYAHFLIKDISSNKFIANPGDIGQDVILFLEISRHNKAGKNEVSDAFYASTMFC